MYNTHEYLLEVETYFGKRRFQVVAENKDEAKLIGAKKSEELYGRDNVIKNTVRVVKKLKPSFGNDMKGL